MRRGMTVMIGLILSIGLGAMPAAAQQSSTAPATKATHAERSAYADPAEMEAMQADVKKMRVILNQMRTNLAFVANSATPLKHQFELEIDMWQMVLDQMERRVGEHSAPK